mmetsp:Transcript_6753/g.16549  ORF Transcript_6753/g.16549 Transcript_6753/m.16549 type:complete len:1118 (+) Transcript_6753:44-3397(+)
MVKGEGRTWDIEDLTNILQNAPRVSDIDDEENAIMHANPRVPKFAAAVPTRITRRQQEHFRRSSAFSRDRQVHHGSVKHKNFDDIKMTTLTERAAVVESARCLKCADAPCTRSCPTSIDIKMFIQCIATKNYYGAAKAILDNNPVGLSCGMVCPTSELCVGSCNMAATEEGPINISGLQEFACSEFMKLGIPQTRNPDAGTGPAFDQPVAIVGAGPAGICCANYLGRLGYSNINVFEKSEMAGGLSSYEIPQFRCHYDGVRWEVRLCEDLGVKFNYNKALGTDFTIETLKKDHAAVFLGIGLYKAKKASMFEGLGPEHGVWTSKEFLPHVSEASKPGCSSKKKSLPALQGHVLVLGAGDTAFDCVGSAFRCGASRVTCVFRKSFTDMRACFEERELCIRECTDFLSNAAPHKVHLDASGKIEGLEIMFQDQLDTDDVASEVGKYREAGTTHMLRCSAVITAFGCEVAEDMKTALAPAAFNPSGFLMVNGKRQCGAPWLFAGGDITGATMTVEAANEGKLAAWSIHEYLQSLHKIVVSPTPQLPLFHTAIDDVDVSVTMAGVRFPNPFGLASAPCSTSAAMIRRAFEAGWGFAVTKTFSLDENLVTNVSPRIVRGTYSHKYGPHQPSFLNIELITEKTAAYWCKAMHELKRDFPDRVIVASVMVGYVKEDWQKICKKSVEAGADIVELNLSCPHGMGEAGMGLACGQDPAIVEEITRWCKEACVRKDGTPVPVFPKLTGNITEIALIAQGCLRGGADGVTCMNTIHGMMDYDPKGETWPKVGDEKKFTGGGISGDANRPMATRACWSIRKFAPGLPIMATGGVSSAASTIQFLHIGASVVQICSALQNQDYTIINDYMSGLKAHLYLNGRGDYDTKEYQNSWHATRPWYKSKEERLVKEPSDIEKLPRFGPFQRNKTTARKEFWQTADPAETRAVSQITPDLEVKTKDVPIPDIESIIGYTHKKFAGFHNDLPREEQVIAIVNPDMCINCGRCYMTCNDNAYQAIDFDSVTHIPEIIEDKCTGCGLCQAVCPVPGCIEYRQMPHKFVPTRGLNVPKDRYLDEGISLSGNSELERRVNHFLARDSAQGSRPARGGYPPSKIPKIEEEDVGRRGKRARRD